MREMFSGPRAFALAGISFRQGDYWARTGVLRPSIMAANGSGTQRCYSTLDVQLLSIGRQMRDAGLSLDLVRSMVEQVLITGIDAESEYVVIVAGECFVVGLAASALAVLESGQVAHVLRPEPLPTPALAV